MEQRHRSVFFTALAGLMPPQFGIPGLKLFDNFRLITAKKDIERIVAQYAYEIGQLDVGHFMQPGICMIYESGITLLERDSTFAQHSNGIVIAKLAKLQNYLSALWLTRDNAANHNVGFLALHHNEEIQVTSNVWMATFSKADGSSNSTSFSKDELIDAKRYNAKSEYGESAGAIELVLPGYHGGRDTKLDVEGGRAQRFLYFVSGARASRDIAIKVALYCSALESLVSNAHSELTHQVAERIAVALSVNIDERLSCYALVKRAYGMRSKAVHGGNFKPNDMAKLRQSVVDIDEICRLLARKLFGDRAFFETLLQEGEAFEEHWRRSILSCA
jgi:hypothetical protein